MKTSTVTKLMTIMVVIGLSASFAFAQPAATPQADTLSGRYEGTAKLDGNDVPVVLELKRDGCLLYTSPSPRDS